MATGHLNPGYIFPISGLEKINKLPPAFEHKYNSGITPEISNKRWLLTQPSVSMDVLETIRREAREKWRSTKQNDCAALTSYLGNYQIKRLEEPTRLRPSSPTRMNNPHPSVIFLTCRLHHLPGFHHINTRSDTPSIKDSSNELETHEYEPDAVSPMQRCSTLSKETDEDSKSSPIDKSSSSSRSYTHPEVERPKTASYIKLNRSSLHSGSQRSKPSSASSLGHSRPQRPYTGVPKYDHYHKEEPFQHRNLIYQKTKYPRGDYSIHYQWPITIQHHHLY